MPSPPEVRLAAARERDVFIFPWYSSDGMPSPERCAQSNVAIFHISNPLSHVKLFLGAFEASYQLLFGMYACIVSLLVIFIF